MWYDRFLLYRNLGPNRTIQEAYRRYRVQHSEGVRPEDVDSTSAGWTDNHRKWNWVQRAAAFDDWIREGVDKEIQAKVAKFRAKAIDDMIWCFNDLVEEWKRIEPGKERKNQVAQAMKTLWREIKVDSGGVSDRKSIQVDIILSKLPPELQKIIRMALEGSEK